MSSQLIRAAQSIVLCIACTTTVQHTFAQEPEYIDTQHRFYVALGRNSLDSEQASNEGIEDQATYLRLAWEGQRQALLFGAGISAFFYSDNEEFEVYVEDIYGDEFTADSSADAFNAYAEIGAAYTPANWVSLDLMAGIEMVFDSSRSIDNCSDCPSEDIDIDSGMYLMPKIKFITPAGVFFNIAYHHYLSGNVENALTFGIGWGR